MGIDKIFELLLLLLIYLYLTPTVVSSSYTGHCNIVTANLSYCPFENDDALTKAMIGLIPIVWVIAPILTVVGYVKLKK
jgi:hypothetical protein